MTEQIIISQLYQLPENLKIEVLHYVEFLRKKYVEKAEINISKKRKFGSAKGKYTLAPDFDAPLDDFKEYM